MSKRLLVTDDALIIREMIKDAAAEADWEIVGEAACGEEAAQKYDELRPDVVTLDMVMPDTDGLYALRTIMQSDPQARVLVVSALDQTAVLKEAIALGAKDFIVKPFAKERLLSALEKIQAN